MKKQNINPEEASSLRQKAEELLHHRDKACLVSTSVTEPDLLKMIHELEVHQIELQMQNEELVIAKEKAELAEEKYTELYDFAPSGYIALSKNGEIMELNFAAAKLLGKERAKLIKRQLIFFVSINTQNTFDLFLQNVFTSKVKQTCEVIIASEGNLPIYVKIDGIVSQNDEMCFLTLIDITEIINANKVIQCSEEKYRISEFDLKKAQRISHIGNWELNNETNVLSWSDEIFRIFDCEPHEFEATYEAFIDFVHPDDREMVNSAYLKSLETKTEYQIEHRIVTKNKQLKYVKEKCTTTFNEQGNPISSFGIVIDITTQKALENELIKAKELAELSEARFRNLMERIDTVAVQGYGPDGITQFWNQASVKLYGYTQQEAIGKNLLDLIIPTEMKVDVTQAILEMAESGEPVPSGELLLKHKDGSSVPVISHHAIVKVPGHAQEFFCLDVDITERKRIEEALRESEAKLSALFGSMSEMVVINELVFDGQGIPVNYRIIDCNEAFTLSADITREKAIGRLSTDVYKTEEPPYLNEFTTVALSGVPYQYEIYFQPTDKYFYVSVISPEKNRFATVTTDITERRKAEKALLEKIHELELFQKLTVGRELTMIQLKKEVNDLLKKAGQESKYTIIE